ncbi:Transposable element Tc1 transposase [Rhizoctonia solani AG-1 IB]|uniref:Transposable element Tc1 transposase n=1 Tax=Thanatephorus cucumeris (strain AG1-IB / isolate 7/3/14) TaxID=1108050 RepID=M5BWE1_THACB|nr:Transposable element Tc1 transposase [Rhizoctonia solani AG-1 IB]
MVRKVAYDAGYRQRVARHKPFITAATRTKRLAWARANKNTNWEGVGWTDEAHIETGERPSHPCVTRKPDEAHLTKSVAPTFQSGRESISLWSCVAIDYKGPIIRLKTSPITVNAKGQKQGGGLTAQGYIDQVLLGPLPKFLKKVSYSKGLDMRVVEDGAAAHRAKVTQAAQEKLGIRQLPHPPSSPDLNPIEPLWLLLKNRVAKIKGSRNSTEKLWEAAQEAWGSITIKEVNMHTKNMPAQVQAILKAKGGHTAF